jgi:hypothetical protein
MHFPTTKDNCHHFSFLAPDGERSSRAAAILACRLELCPARYESQRA